MHKKSLASRQNPLASAQHQLELLEQRAEIPGFNEKLAKASLPPLRPLDLEVFQVNIGKMCNQVCSHCHVDAGPDRKEMMSQSTMSTCVELAARLPVNTIDITGGAPEMHPHFRWFVESLSSLRKKVIVRSNLTIIVANRKFNDLPSFYRNHGVEIVSSLPFYRADRTDRQRGEGVFDDSVKALRMLNTVGYGKPGTGLILNLVYNPSGAFLPASQVQLEKDFKIELKKGYDVEFNKLFCITNMPISRYLEYLIDSGNYERYMDRLVEAFNPLAAESVMCRKTLSIGWDGFLYDCDFNQMLDMKVSAPVTHIRDFDLALLEDRDIRVGQHCYGCTAGSGSSCGGATI